jgi:hypothetical protein
MPDFHVFRIVLAQPGFMADMTAQIFTDHPERRHTVLGPEAMFALISLHLGQPPAYRVSFVDDDLPDRARAGEALPFRVTLRNDGFDTWTPGEFRLGVHLSTGAIPAHSLPSDPQGYPQRFGLVRAVGPGEEVSVEGTLTLPAAPGDYLVQLDMVHEGVTWFETRRNLPWQTLLRLTSE